MSAKRKRKIRKICNECRENRKACEDLEDMLMEKEIEGKVRFIASLYKRFGIDVEIDFSEYKTGA